MIKIPLVKIIAIVASNIAALGQLENDLQGSDLDIFRTLPGLLSRSEIFMQP